METPGATVDPRRAELADFLRTRRAELTTELAGLPPTPRRRTPGLRREEVAELAGISVALYTWLEQGRDVPVSSRTIDLVASALQLSPGERTHVHRLARRADTDLNETISPALRRLVAGSSVAMFVLDHAWDVVLRSPAAIAIFGGDPDPEHRENLLESMFVEPRFRALFADWESVANSVLELFRLDYALYADTPHVHALVERLRTTCDGFGVVWDRHKVRSHPYEMRLVNHPTAGSLQLDPTTYTVTESPGLHLLVYAPFDDETRERVARLITDSETR